MRIVGLAHFAGIAIAAVAAAFAAGATATSVTVMELGRETHLVDHAASALVGIEGEGELQFRATDGCIQLIVVHESEACGAVGVDDRGLQVGKVHPDE